ncbi:unnamed protein product [Heterobilharzia americana]|nr:unnamed protein product [Heterobilharzia americana]
MKAHSSSTLPPGSVLIQSGQTIPQSVSMAALQANNVTSVPQNLQVWTPSPSGTITVSGITSSRNSTNLVTLPSGQTVLMANLVTTATTGSISLPTSSLAKQQIQVPSGPLATQLTNPTVIQGPNGPMSMALPGGIISNNALNSFNNPSNAFVPNPMGNMATDQPVHIAQIIDNQLHTGTACFTTNAGFQGIAPMNQVILDSSSFNLGAAQTQNKLINMSPVRPHTLVSSPMQHINVGNSFVTAGNLPRGLSSDSSLSETVVGSNTQNLSIQETAGYSVQDDSSLVIQNSTSTIPSSNTTLPEIPCSTEDSQTNIESKCVVGEQTNSMFTSSSLSELLTEFEPHLQLDHDVEEVMTNLANEFIVNCAEKAQKLASHRGSSSVEGKDVAFCMEREWNIVVPGFISEERPMRKNLTSEAHRQRLALMKKQIKKYNYFLYERNNFDDHPIFARRRSTDHNKDERNPKTCTGDPNSFIGKHLSTSSLSRRIQNVLFCLVELNPHNAVVVIEKCIITRQFPGLVLDLLLGLVKKDAYTLMFLKRILLDSGQDIRSWMSNFLKLSSSASYLEKLNFHFMAITTNLIPHDSTIPLDDSVILTAITLLRVLAAFRGFVNYNFPPELSQKLLILLTHRTVISERGLQYISYSLAFLIGLRWSLTTGLSLDTGSNNHGNNRISMSIDVENIIVTWLQRLIDEQDIFNSITQSSASSSLSYLHNCNQLPKTISYIEPCYFWLYYFIQINLRI